MEIMMNSTEGWAAPIAFEAGSICAIEADTTVDALRLLPEVRASYFADRYAYAACITSACGARPAEGWAPQAKIWGECAALSTGGGRTLMFSSPAEQADAAVAVPRDAPPGQMCALEPEMNDLLFGGDPEAWWAYIRQRDAVEGCLLAVCGTRPAEGRTREWDACAAQHVMQLDCDASPVQFMKLNAAERAVWLEKCRPGRK